MSEQSVETFYDDKSAGIPVFKCGACEQRFPSIYELHCHISSHNDTGAYHFDPVMSVGYPKFEVTCSCTQTEDTLTSYWTELEFRKHFTQKQVEIENYENIDSFSRKTECEANELGEDCEKGSLSGLDTLSHNLTGITNVGNECEIYDNDDGMESKGLNKDNKNDSDHFSADSKAKGLTQDDTCKLNRKEGEITKQSDMNFEVKELRVVLERLKQTEIAEYCKQNINVTGKRFRQFKRKMTVWNEFSAVESKLKQKKGRPHKMKKYFHGKLQFKDFTIDRPHVASWDKSGSSAYKVVQVTKTCDLPSAWTEEQSVSKNMTCNSNFTMDELKTGMKVAVDDTGRRIFTCNFCGKVLKAKSSLEGHLNKHLGRKPYICELCGKAFPSKHYIHLHKKSAVHAPKEEYMKCEKCEKSYPNLFSLSRHIKLRHTPKEFNVHCKICDKAFPYQAYLTRHMRVHRTEESKKYACEICGKKYYLESNLKDHMKTHFTTYKCDTCEKQFSSHSSLMRHAKIHNAQKDHVCHICGNNFVQKSQYWVHMEKHHDLTKEELMVMFPEKHIRRHFHHKLDELKERVQPSGDTGEEIRNDSFGDN